MDHDDLDSDEPARRPTMQDVAARAGVALSTVSRALGNHPDVSRVMKRRVERAAGELGYEPNFLAQSLRTGTTNTVGFVIRDIGNPFFAAIANGAERELRQQGFVMLLVNSDGDPTLEAEHIDVLRRRRVDGLIINLVDETHPAPLEAIGHLTCPLVLVDRELADRDVARVLCDHYGGVRAAVDDLIERGHRRVALITGRPVVRPVRERLRGYVEAFAAHGLEVDHDLVALESFTTDFANQRTLQLLDHADPPTAVLTGGVQVTIGCLTAFAERSIRPMVDVDLVALDEVEMLGVYRPHISVVLRDPHRMGAQAAQLFIEQHTGAAGRTVTLDTIYRPGQPRTDAG